MRLSSIPKDMKSNRVLFSKKAGPYIVTSYMGTFKVLICFLNTGNEKLTSASCIRRNLITDRAALYSEESPTCELDGCDNPTRDRCKKGVCETHYYRMRRTGRYDLAIRDPNKVTETSHGYLIVSDKNHPLAGSNHSVYQHRQVLFNSDPDMCCWGGGELQTWESCHVDHIDENKENNDVSNLRISCPKCNQGRGRWKKILTQGVFLTFNGETHHLSEWGRITGFGVSVICYRVKKKWSTEDVLTTPIGGCRAKR